MGSRRDFLKTSAALGAAAAGGGCASMMPAEPADTLIVWFSDLSSMPDALACSSSNWEKSWS